MPSASSIAQLESRKNSSERISAALKDLVDLVNVFDGECKPVVSLTYT
jgi:hypothetical protein